jgi:1-deoxy-D-xylulose 5-phosphate reductoisomerase
LTGKWLRTNRKQIRIAQRNTQLLSKPIVTETIAFERVMQVPSEHLAIAQMIPIKFNESETRNDYLTRISRLITAASSKTQLNNQTLAPIT